MAISGFSNETIRLQTAYLKLFANNLQHLTERSFGRHSTLDRVRGYA
jgi:hypothetical protein